MWPFALAFTALYCPPSRLHAYAVITAGTVKNVCDQGGGIMLITPYSTCAKKRAQHACFMDLSLWLITSIPPVSCYRKWMKHGGCF